ncbi:MAG: hypothetical protein EKK55_21950, partial [Rhodocyclaceae bacterium]
AFTEALALGNLRIVAFAGADAAEHIREAHLWDEAARLFVPWLFDANACVPGDRPAPGVEPAPAPELPPGVRVLRVASPMLRGDDVKAWQAYLLSQGAGLAVDGVFGPVTARKTRWFQRAFAVDETGALDAVTLEKAVGAGFQPVKAPAPAPKPKPAPSSTATPSPTTSPAVVDFDNLPQIPALYFHPGRFDSEAGAAVEPDLLVLHVFQASETSRTAENVGAYFKNPRDAQGRPRPASYHYGVDNDSVAQYVREADTAFHAPGANHNGIGLGMAGFSEQSPAEWGDGYSSAMLQLSARLAAWIIRRHGWQVRFLDAAALQRGERRGITTHWEVTKAYGRSTHTDPGKSFPMTAYLGMVQAAL